MGVGRIARPCSGLAPEGIGPSISPSPAQTTRTRRHSGMAGPACSRNTTAGCRPEWIDERTTSVPTNNRRLAMQIHAVSAQEWEAARQQLLVKEKQLTHARDAMAAERRRMPWLAVEKKYAFEGPKGKASLRDLFEGRHQLIIYRAFYEPGVFGWPDPACRGCSLVADQVAHIAHLNARDTTLVFASRAPQADIARQKARV